MKKYWKVGEVAELTGLTIRTVRYYDQIELLTPSERTESGHRLYTKSDLTELQQILSLKQMGLSLDEIKKMMGNKNEDSAITIIEAQIDRLQNDIHVQKNLLNELEMIVNMMRSKDRVSVNDITQLLGAMKMYQEKYFSKQQLENIKNFYQNTNQDELKNAEEQFMLVLEEIRIEMEKETSPSNVKVRKLAEEWRSILDSITVDDPAIWKKAEQFHTEIPDNELQFGMDAEVYQYINEALNWKSSE